MGGKAIILKPGQYYSLISLYEAIVDRINVMLGTEYFELDFDALKNHGHFSIMTKNVYLVDDVSTYRFSINFDKTNLNLKLLGINQKETVLFSERVWQYNDGQNWYKQVLYTKEIPQVNLRKFMCITINDYAQGWEIAGRPNACTFMLPIRDIEQFDYINFDGSKRGGTLGEINFRYPITLTKLKIRLTDETGEELPLLADIQLILRLI